MTFVQLNGRSITQPKLVACVITASVLTYIVILRIKRMEANELLDRIIGISRRHTSKASSRAL